MYIFIRNIIVSLAMGLLLTTNALAQSAQRCSRMGLAGNDSYAVWKDTYRYGQAQLPGRFSDSYCPDLGSRSSVFRGIGGLNSYCVVLSERYTYYHDRGLGSYGMTGNRITQEAFNYDVCRKYHPQMYYPGINLYNLCVAEGVTANQAYYAPTTLDCNNMEAVWGGPYGERWEVKQVNLNTAVSGIVRTGYSTDVQDRCGIWDISGSISGDGALYITVTSRNYEQKRLTKPWCQKSFKVWGRTTGALFMGSYVNSRGQDGPFYLLRNDPLPGSPPNSLVVRESKPQLDRPLTTAPWR